MSDSSENEREDALGSDHPGQRYEDVFDTVPEPPEPPAPPAIEQAVEVESDDVDSEVQKHFWRLVFVIKFTVLSLTLGMLLLVFEERTILGWQLVAAGVLLAGYTVYRYRESKSWLDSSEFDRADDDGSSDDATTKP